MLTFDHVTKQFTEDSYGVRDITFEIEPGEFVFITGPSGSGKTTLMRLMTREYTPTEGEIHLEDLPVSALKNSQLHELRRRIGVVFQDYRLLTDLNVWENIALPLYIIGKKQAEIEERVTDLLKLVELTDKALLFPRQLSGGEAQRISIARALATGPGIIFADEPTGNLDNENAVRIGKLLHKINELGTTVLMATHDENVLGVFKGTRRMRLDNGKLVEDKGKKKASVSVRVKDAAPNSVEDDKNRQETGKKELETENDESAETQTEKPAKKGLLGDLLKKKSKED
jgi:cell division transport system ATP-binding protein